MTWRNAVLVVSWQRQVHGLNVLHGMSARARTTDTVSTTVSLGRDEMLTAANRRCAGDRRRRHDHRQQHQHRRWRRRPVHVHVQRARHIYYFSPARLSVTVVSMTDVWSLAGLSTVYIRIVSPLVLFRYSSSLLPVREKWRSNPALSVGDSPQGTCHATAHGATYVIAHVRLSSRIAWQINAPGHVALEYPVVWHVYTSQKLGRQADRNYSKPGK